MCVCVCVCVSVCTYTGTGLYVHLYIRALLLMGMRVCYHDKRFHKSHSVQFIIIYIVVINICQLYTSALVIVSYS